MMISIGMVATQIISSIVNISLITKQLERRDSTNRFVPLRLGVSMNSSTGRDYTQLF